MPTRRPLCPVGCEQTVQVLIDCLKAKSGTVLWESAYLLLKQVRIRRAGDGGLVIGSDFASPGPCCRVRPQGVSGTPAGPGRNQAILFLSISNETPTGLVYGP